MKRAVIGSRSLADDRFFTMAQIASFRASVAREVASWAEGDVLVSGGAAGPDRWAEEAFRAQGRGEPIILRPDYSTHPGHIAPLKRNEDIAREADCCVAFYDGNSGGTMQAVRCFERLGKPVKVRRLKQSLSGGGE